MKTSIPRAVKIRLRDELEREIYELQERLTRQDDTYEMLCYQQALVNRLGQESPDLAEIDDWELEGQLLDLQCKELRQQLAMLRQDLLRQCRLLEYVIRDLGETPKRQTP